MPVTDRSMTVIVEPFALQHFYIYACDGDLGLARRLVASKLIFNSAISKLLIGNSNRRRGGGLALHFQWLGSG